MEKRPLKQDKIINVDVINQELKDTFGSIFNNKQEINRRIDSLIIKLESLQNNGLVFNKEKIVKDLRESVDIKNQEEFIFHLLKTLEPIVALRINQSKIFEKVQRENTINSNGNLKLSEVLYTSLNEQNKNEIFIHLAPAEEFIKENGIANLKKEVEKGLAKLAEIVESNKNIEKITATSWIVAKNPLILERLGFTVVGEISEKERMEDFNNEKRPVAKAFIERSDFLARYYNK